MIYLFAGDDIRSKASASEKFIDSLPKGVEVFYISRNNLDKIEFQSLYSGSGLFTKKFVVILQGILEYEDNRDFMLSKLEKLNASANDFVFIEGKLTKAVLEEFKENGAKVNIFELPKIKKEKYDNFLVANAFASGDKFNTWYHYREAMRLGVGLEEIVGVVFWKMKDMILKKNFRQFSEEKLKDSAFKLSYLLPSARKEGRDPEVALEQFLLEVF